MYEILPTFGWWVPGWEEMFFCVISFCLVSYGFEKNKSKKWNKWPSDQVAAR